MRVPDTLARCVAFVMYKPRGREELAYAGTCFLVQVPISTPGRAMQYMVTAWHIVAEIMQRTADGLVYVRANRLDGDITHVKSRVSDWHRHPSDTLVDIAATPWQPHDIDDSVQPPRATPAPMDLVPVGTDVFATPEKIASNKIGIGDEILCIGLFSRFVGTGKNLPILRAGVIALMPAEPVPTKYFGNIEAFLIEVRSVGGLSGSPIFLLSTSPRVVAKDEVKREGLFMLVGLVHGHWDTPDTLPSTDAVVSEERLNVGIAVGIPASKILEVLDHPEFKRMREELERTGQARLPGT